jgi:hypothetical protein
VEDSADHLATLVRLGDHLGAAREAGVEGGPHRGRVGDRAGQPSGLRAVTE